MSTTYAPEPPRVRREDSPEHRAGSLAEPEPSRIRERTPGWVWVARAIAVLILTGILLVLWRGVAYSGEAGSAPPSLEEWIRGLPPMPAEPAAEPPGPEPPADSGTTEPSGAAPQPAGGETVLHGNGVAVEVATPTSRRAGVEPPCNGPLAAPAMRRAEPIGSVADAEIPWLSTLDLAVAFELEFTGRPPPIDPRVLRASLIHHLIDLSVSIGHTDNPKENLEAIRGYIATRMQLVATRRDQETVERLRPGTVLAEKRGSPLAVALIALVLADRASPYLNLEGVRAGDLVALRYRAGHHRYILIPTDLDRLYTDRELAEMAFGAPGLAGGAIEALTRRELWGWIFGETGTALLAEGDAARAARFVERGLALFEAQAGAHIAQARLRLEARDLAGAREELARAIELEPASTLARLQRVEILEALGDGAAVEEDLRWLSRHAAHPEAGLALARHLLARRRFGEALEEIERVESRAIPAPALRDELAGLRRDILAAPWLATLADSARPDRDRFEALERLRSYPSRGCAEALAGALDDPNLRLSRYAWQVLTEQTGWSLPCTAWEWRRALAEHDFPVPRGRSP